MMLLLFLALGLLLVGTVLLVVGADWFLDGAGDFARALGVSALVIGVLLAGLEPEEMLTAAIASARGAPALAVGNVIGTNVTIVTAALGISALIFPLVIDKSVRRQALIATLVSVLPIVLLFLGIVTQLAGVLLLVVFVGYTLFLFRTDQEAIKHIHAPEEDDEDSEKAWPSGPRLHWKPVLLTFGGLAAMAGGGPAIVEGALRLTQTIGISQGAVGVTPTTILWYSNYQALATRDIGVVPRHRSPRGGTYDRACDRSGSIPRAAPVHPGQPLRSLRSGEAHQEGVPRRLGHLRPGPHPARLRAHAHDARVHRGVSR